MPDAIALVGELSNVKLCSVEVGYNRWVLDICPRPTPPRQYYYLNVKQLANANPNPSPKSLSLESFFYKQGDMSRDPATDY